MIIGEAPGRTEAQTNSPFIGRAGDLLSKILKEAGIDREKCYVTNATKCLPTDNGKKIRPPSQIEIDNCKKWLWSEIKTVNPRLIFTLGKIPTFLLLSKQLKKSLALKDVVGKSHSVDYINSTIIPNYHPSWLMQYGKEYTKQATLIFEAGNKLYGQAITF
jgi:uracil-DNA glycosylase family 4